MPKIAQSPGDTQWERRENKSTQQAMDVIESNTEEGNDDSFKRTIADSDGAAAREQPNKGKHMFRT